MGEGAERGVSRRVYRVQLFDEQNSWNDELMLLLAMGEVE